MHPTLAARPVRRLVAALAVVGSLVLAGCGGDDDPSSDPAPAAADGNGQSTNDVAEGGGASSEDPGDGAGGYSGGSGDGTSTGMAEAIGGDDVAEALDAVGLEGKGHALVVASGADRYEVEGGVLHLYLGGDASMPEGVECMIVGSVLTGEEKAVVHRADGTEVSCP